MQDLYTLHVMLFFQCTMNTSNEELAFDPSITVVNRAILSKIRCEYNRSRKTMSAMSKLLNK